MTITQSVEVTENREITLKVPHEVPTGLTNVIVQFPIKETSVKRRMNEIEEIELFKLYADELNAEAEDVLLYQDTKL
jgi:hypothetical protein